VGFKGDDHLLVEVKANEQKEVHLVEVLIYPMEEVGYSSVEARVVGFKGEVHLLVEVMADEYKEVHLVEVLIYPREEVGDSCVEARVVSQSTLVPRRHNTHLEVASLRPVVEPLRVEQGAPRVTLAGILPSLTEPSTQDAFIDAVVGS